MFFSLISAPHYRRLEVSQSACARGRAAAGAGGWVAEGALRRAEDGRARGGALEQVRVVQGSMNMSAMYDSGKNNMESSVVARGDLWRAEVSHSTSGGGSSAPRGAGDAASLLLVLIQLDPVLFIRDTRSMDVVELQGALPPSLVPATCSTKCRVVCYFVAGWYS